MLRSPLTLFAVALLIRVVALWLVADQYSANEYWNQFSDTRFFRDVAEWFADQNPDREGSLLLVGPGYGFILYAGSLFYGWNAFWHLLIQILISAVNCLLIRRLALKMELKESVATLAGYLSAVSLTAVTSSVMLYSETWFVTLTLLAFITFLNLLKHPNTQYMLATAALLTAAAYVRSVGQFLPVVLLVILLMGALIGRTPLRAVIRPLSALALSLAIISLWPLRNLVTHDIFTISETGTRAARTYWTASALAGGRDEPAIESIRVAWDEELAVRFDTAKMTFKQLHDFDVSVVRDTLRVRPSAMIGSYCSNVYDNMKQECRLQHILFPQFSTFWSWLSKRLTSGLGKWMILLSILGGALIWFQGSKFSALFLLTGYLYFGLITGVTFWQDSRIFFPGQITGLPLISVSLYEVASRILRRISVR